MRTDELRPEPSSSTSGFRTATVSLSQRLSFCPAPRSVLIPRIPDSSNDAAARRWARRLRAKEPLGPPCSPDQRPVNTARAGVRVWCHPPLPCYDRRGHVSASRYGAALLSRLRLVSQAGTPTTSFASARHRPTSRRRTSDSAAAGDIASSRARAAAPLPGTCFLVLSQFYEESTRSTSSRLADGVGYLQGARGDVAAFVAPSIGSRAAGARSIPGPGEHARARR